MTVSDSGLGIAPEDLERIFKRFERAVSARHFGGLGLGLWITRQSVESLGGSIAVQSRPGFGSAFSVELPLRGPVAGRTLLAPAPPPSALGRVPDEG
jgi:signal transduction histidine kinase